MDEDEVPKAPVHQVGMVLDPLSVDELQERIAILKAEIERLEKVIENKTQSRSAAESVFKI